MNSSGSFREQDRGCAQHLGAARSAGKMSDTEVEEGPGNLSAHDRRPVVGSQRPIQCVQVHGRRTETNRRLLFPGTLLMCADKPGESVATERLTVASHPPQQATVGGRHDPAAHFGHRSDCQLPLSDLESAYPDVYTALHRKTLDPVLGVLREGTSGNPSLIVHTVDDQAAMGHGHRRNRVEDIAGNSAFEVEHFVLHLPEQVTEGLRRQPVGEVV